MYNYLFKTKIKTPLLLVLCTVLHCNIYNYIKTNKIQCGNDDVDDDDDDDGDDDDDDNDDDAHCDGRDDDPWRMYSEH